MNELASKLTLSDRTFMKKVFDFMDSLIIKSEYDANQNETAESAERARMFMAAMNGKASIFDYSNYITTIVLKDINTEYEANGKPKVFKPERISLLTTDRAEFLKTLNYKETSALLERALNAQKNHYVEKNEYYRILAGKSKLDMSNSVTLIDPYYDEDDPNKYVALSDLYYESSGHTEWYNTLKANGNLGFKNLVKDIYDGKYDYTDSQMLVNPDLEITYIPKGTYYEYFDHLGLYSVDYYTARKAKNFQILAYNPTILNDYDTKRFIIAYYMAMDYVTNVPYVKNYSANYELYDRYMSIVILFQALLIFLNNKMDTYLQNRFSTLEDKRNFFAQYNLEGIIDQLNDTQLNTIADHIDELVSLKGSDQAILRLLELLKINNVNVCKYLVFKTPKYSEVVSGENGSWKGNLEYKFGKYDEEKNRIVPTTLADNYDLKLVQIPLEYRGSLAKHITNNSKSYTLKTVVGHDPYFGETDFESGSNEESLKSEYFEEYERILKIDSKFNQFYSKYIGVVSEIDTMKSIIYSSCLFSSLFCDSEDHDGDINTRSIMYTNSSAYGTASIKDLFVAINYVDGLRRNLDCVEGDETLSEILDMRIPIPSADSIKYLISFNKVPDLDELENKEISLINEKTGDLFTVKLKNALTQYLSEINEKREANNKLIEDDFIFVTKKYNDEVYNTEVNCDSKLMHTRSYTFNVSKYEALMKRMENCSSYKEYQILQAIYDYNMMYKEYVNLYGSYETYNDYLQGSNSTLYQYIKDYLAGAASLRYVIGTNKMTHEENQILKFTDDYITGCKNLITTFIEDILSALELNSELETNIKGGHIDSLAIFNKIISIVELFKSYTVQFTNTGDTYTNDTLKDLVIKVFGYIGAFKGIGHDVSDNYELFHILKNGTGKIRTKYNLPNLYKWIEYYTNLVNEIKENNPNDYESNEEYINNFKTLCELEDYTRDLETVIEKYHSNFMEDKIPLLRDSMDSNIIESDYYENYYLYNEISHYIELLNDIISDEIQRVEGIINTIIENNPNDYESNEDYIRYSELLDILNTYNYNLICNSDEELQNNNTFVEYLNELNVLIKEVEEEIGIVHGRGKITIGNKYDENFKPITDDNIENYKIINNDPIDDSITINHILEEE